MLAIAMIAEIGLHATHSTTHASHPSVRPSAAAPAGGTSPKGSGRERVRIISASMSRSK